MRSRTTRQFRQQLRTLPDAIQRQAKAAHQRFEVNPWDQSLRFKQVHPSQPIYSVRITKGYRAIGKRDAKGMLWFWVGSHADYDHVLSRR